MNKELLKQKKERLKEKIELWKEEKEIIMAEQDLQQDIIKIKNRKKLPKQEKQKLTTTKILMIFLFASCSAVEAFTMYAILKAMNMGYGVEFGPLSMLITAVVAEVIGFAIYSLKSMKENTKGGIVYDSAMHNYETASLEDEAEG